MTMAKYMQILSHGSWASKDVGKGMNGNTTGEAYSTRTGATPTTPSIVCVCVCGARLE
jgi:hypothetical protein